MEEKKHTLGRWHVDGHNTVAVISEIVKEGLTQDWPQYQHVCTCDYGYADPAAHLELNKANAEFIVRACNSYDDMVQMLKDVAKEYEYCLKLLAEAGKFQYSESNLSINAKKLIAKAQPKQ